MQFYWSEHACRVNAKFWKVWPLEKKLLQLSWSSSSKRLTRILRWNLPWYSLTEEAEGDELKPFYSNLSPASRQFVNCYTTCLQASTMRGAIRVVDRTAVLSRLRSTGRLRAQAAASTKQNARTRQRNRRWIRRLFRKCWHWRTRSSKTPKYKQNEISPRPSRHLHTNLFWASMVKWHNKPAMDFWKEHVWIRLVCNFVCNPYNQTTIIVSVTVFGVLNFKWLYWGFTPASDLEKDWKKYGSYWNPEGRVWSDLGSFLMIFLMIVAMKILIFSKNLNGFLYDFLNDS